MLRMDTGSEFQADGPATKNARSSSLVKMDGRLCRWEYQ